MTVHFEPLNATAGVEAAPAGAQDNLSRSRYGESGKRAFDLLVVIAILPILLPMLLVLYVVVFFTSGSPVYRQRRVGRDGREFTMLKFRTMVQDAEAKLASHLKTSPEAREEWNRDQKLRRDPRITRIGRILRKTSLDELPQFLNVLVGDMSLVGPRPMMVDQRGLYPGSEYYLMRPGITGFWQISDRNHCSFSQRASHDAAYFRVMSLRTDLTVLAKTVVVVLRGTGC